MSRPLRAEYAEFGWHVVTVGPDEKIRDGKSAVANAERANEAGGGNDPWSLDALAAAYAELGDFSRAREYETKAIGLLKNDTDKAERRARLDLYEQNTPYREKLKPQESGTGEPAKLEAAKSTG